MTIGVAITGSLIIRFGFSLASLLLLPLAYVSWRHGRWVGAVIGFCASALLYQSVRLLGGDLTEFVNQGLGPGSLILASSGFLIGYISERNEISLHAEASAKLGRDALELVVADLPLSELLDKLILRVEQELPEGRCSILVLDQDKGILNHAAGPRLPAVYCNAIDGLKIGASAGSCGTAAFRNEPVIVTNTQTDPLWNDFATLAKQSDLKACWSIPIRDAQQEVLGTYAIYYDHQRAPTDHELALVSEAANLSGLALLRDSDRKKQLELEKQVQTAQKLDGLGMLAGGIAHDFNNILVSIIGNAELLSLELGTPEHNDRLDGIVNAAQRAAGLSRQILMYAGGNQGQLSNVDLSSMVDELRSLMTVANSNQVDLKLELTTDLPRVSADESQLHQVLINLVTNAIESAAKSGNKVVVRTRQQQVDRAMLNGALLGKGLEPGSYVCLEVEDNGAGMSEEVKQDIFNPFYSTKANGRGLGLAILFGVLRRCRGALSLESTPGKGARFRVLFPAAIRDRADEEPVIPRWQGEGMALVVDDEPEVRKVAADYLKALGYSPVEIVIGGAEGLQAVQEFGDEIKLLLVDLNMPEVNGKQVIDEALKRRAKAKIVLMTGNDSDVTNLFKDQNVFVLHKPFTLETLSKTLLRTKSNDH